MSPDTVISRHPDIIATEIDGEVVLMSLATGRTFGFDARGNRIWSLLDEPKSINVLVAQLVEHYETTPDRCQADLVEFAQKLAEAQLILLK